MDDDTRVLLCLHIGHRSEMLDEATSLGHTHRWTVFVRSAGPYPFSDRSFITKVVFDLHPDFMNPRRVIRDPPFEVTETGYAGFVIPVHVSFSGTPKTYNLIYDMNLCLEKQSEHLVEQILEFKRPSPDFFNLIMKYGGRLKKERKKTEKQSSRKEKKQKQIWNEEETKVRAEEHNTTVTADVAGDNSHFEESKVKVEATEIPAGCSSSARKTKESSSRRAEKQVKEENEKDKTSSSDEYPYEAKKSKKEEQNFDSLISLQRKLMTLDDPDKLLAVVDSLLAPSSGTAPSMSISEENSLLSFDMCTLSATLISKLEDIVAERT